MESSAELISNSDMSQLSLRELASCVAVARHGSAQRAAAALGYAQSTVTLHVQNVERLLGVQLFDRPGKRLALTAQGRLLVTEGERLLAQLDDLRARLHGVAADATGHVAIGAIEPFASQRLPPILAAYRRRAPGVRVALRVGGNTIVRELLQTGTLDFAVIGKPPSLRGVHFTPLFDEKFVLLVPAAHRFARAKRVRLRDLAHETLLLSEETCVYRQLVSSAIDEGGVDGVLRASFGTVASLPFGVAAGLGIAAVPAIQARDLPRDVVAVPLTAPGLTVSIGTVVSTGAVLSPAAAALRTFVEAELLRRRA